MASTPMEIQAMPNSKVMEVGEVRLSDKHEGKAPALGDEWKMEMRRRWEERREIK